MFLDIISSLLEKVTKSQHKRFKTLVIERSVKVLTTILLFFEEQKKRDKQRKADAKRKKELKGKLNKKPSAEEVPKPEDALMAESESDDDIHGEGS
jgi:hypothetical protein